MFGAGRNMAVAGLLCVYLPQGASRCGLGRWGTYSHVLSPAPLQTSADDVDSRTLWSHASGPRFQLCKKHKRIFVMYMCPNCNIWDSEFVGTNKS